MENFWKADNDWAVKLQCETNKDYFQNLMRFLELQYREFDIYPPKDRIFYALQCTPYSNIKVCILGQDPYHDNKQANGLAFAVNNNIAPPPSLQNICKEINNSLGGFLGSEKYIDTKSTSITLENIASQGVLFLNTILTVKAHCPLSHKGMGWEIFTDKIIELCAEKSSPIVFMLWGKNAQSKKEIIERCDKSKKHLVLCSSHPSPLSVYRGFSGSGHFKKANQFLRSNSQEEIDWFRV